MFDPHSTLTNVKTLHLRGGRISVLSNDLSSIRKLERKLGHNEKLSRGAKKDGWDSLMSGLDKVLAIQDSQEEDPKRRGKTNSRGGESQDPQNKLDVPVRAAREADDENGQ